ncbi:hypothetical protein DSC45_32230 [Streptomyces sp. YIM 130001]|uniref:hypothetical protein n=1 Tax=Streptomyces sp. YIM 130001 TaxID=2259644 RepID=UPI000EC17B62|nr:hypothetical protein [Streptomyces sp. YIM 130001]RII09194.1 hypothetical protein DSC45_32230 [Streptomyces sp. YIM 130001]
MNEFFDAALGFPAALFTAALVVVVCFWLLVLLGACEHDSFDGDVNTGAAGLGGVPVAITASLVITVAWGLSLTGSVLVERSAAQGTLRQALSAAVLVVALLLAWAVTRILLRPLRALFPDEPEPSRLDFIGLTCTVRTSRVDQSFGQAEVTAADGAVALVQVRVDPHAADSGLTAGSTALLYAYDDDGEFFWAAPYDAELDPRRGRNSGLGGPALGGPPTGSIESVRSRPPRTGLGRSGPEPA